MAYAILISKKAKKQIQSLDKKTALLVRQFLTETLAKAENPRLLQNCKKLEGVEDGWQWRLGSYRILGIIEDDVLIITVFRVGHRREAYRNL